MTVFDKLSGLRSLWRPEALRSDAWARRRETDKPCAYCGSSEAFFVRTTVNPDFDPRTLEAGVRAAFLKKQNGYCVACGLFQDYRKLSEEHIVALNRLGKDELTRDPTYQNYPPPRDAVASFNNEYFSKRLRRWAPFLESRKVSNALFLRFWWGAAPAFVAERYGAAVSGIDMSPTCARYIGESMPAFRVLDGEINGHFAGPFLATGPYDAIFVFHVLCHSFDVKNSLQIIRRLLAPGGVAIFTHEVVRKPSNPFHRIHPNESQLVSLLRTSFDHVYRLDDCEDVVSAAVNPYTLKGDVPDFGAS